MRVLPNFIHKLISLPENTLSACTEAGLEKCEPQEGSKKTGTSGIGIPAGVTVDVFCR